MTSDRTETLDRLKRETLSFLTFTDDMGLWEPYHTVRSWDQVQDGQRDRPNEGLAEEAIRQLFREGLIYLYRAPWGDHLPSEPVPLSDEEVEAELTADWWRAVPPETGGVRISATPRGQQAAR